MMRLSHAGPGGEQADEQPDEQAEPGARHAPIAAARVLVMRPVTCLDEAQVAADDRRVLDGERRVGQVVDGELRPAVGRVAGDDLATSQCLPNPQHRGSSPAAMLMGTTSWRVRYPILVERACARVTAAFIDGQRQFDVPATVTLTNSGWLQCRPDAYM